MLSGTRFRTTCEKKMFRLSRFADSFRKYMGKKVWREHLYILKKIKKKKTLEATDKTEKLSPF